jgi:CubicO group peptidase (beta-lactamase class C family)
MALFTEFFGRAEKWRWTKVRIGTVFKKLCRVASRFTADASGGLISTVDDYAAFGQMMLGQGTHGPHRILSARSLEMMTTNQLTPDQVAAASAFLDGRGWGLGLSVIPDRGFGWDGGCGTSWASHPRPGALGMTQRLVYPISSGIDVDFWTHVQEALRG